MDKPSSFCPYGKTAAYLLQYSFEKQVDHYSYFPSKSVKINNVCYYENIILKVLYSNFTRIKIVAILFQSKHLFENLMR